MKKHIGIAVDVSGEVKGATYCGQLVPSGQWKAGAAYQGLRILGSAAEDFCPECQQHWLRIHNEEKGGSSESAQGR